MESNLADIIQQQQQQIQLLIQQQQVLQQQLNSQKEQHALSGQKEPKVPMPDKFDGNPTKFKTFQMQLQTVFELNASRFQSDKIKIMFIGTLLTANAAQWFYTLDKPENKPMKEDLDAFMQ